MNTVIFALSEDHAREAILKLQRENLINIIAWLGADKGQGVITHDYREMQNIDALREYYEICPRDVYDKVYQKLYVFLDMVFRNGERPIYEYVNLFNMWVNFYYGLFSKRTVQLVIFGDNPHFGVDSIAKDVANAMGIPTVLFQQAFEDNRFFAFLSSEDVGVFEALPNDGEFHVTLDGKFKKNSPATNISRIRTRRMRYEKTSRKNSDRIRDIPGKIYRNRGHLLAKIKETTAEKFHQKGRAYVAQSYFQKNSARAMQRKSVDLNVPYIYFPLHAQPEASTSVLGKEYCDQLLALERLADFIPSDWRIYVKENPLQTYYMRESLFFRRLELIEKAQYVNHDVSTYDLMANAQFVATITGSAGWEAISGGKPVLVFGLAWYRKFPGVFEYQNHPSLDDILQCQIDIREVETAYNRLNSKAYPGILQLGREDIIEGYTPEKNNELLYNAFVHILDLLQAGDAQPTD